MLIETLMMYKKTVAAVLIIGIVLIGYVSYILIDRSSKIAVVITAVPSDAKISLGDTIYGTGNQYVKEGTYIVTATKDGFAKFTSTVYVQKSGQQIIIPLSPVSDDAKSWAKKHQSDYLKLEGIAGENARAEGKEFSDKNPIVAKLPYKNFLYSIGYRNDNSDPSGSSIILEIQANEGYRQAAIYQIYQLGFDPTLYKINFSDYTNPFTS